MKNASLSNDHLGFIITGFEGGKERQFLEAFSLLKIVAIEVFFESLKITARNGLKGCERVTEVQCWSESLSVLFQLYVKAKHFSPFLFLDLLFSSRGKEPYIPIPSS